jgi:pterin-4a-carbinolamine dehydratase
MPSYVEELLAPLPVGGGVVGIDGGTPPLTEDELRAALAGLPLWSGDRRALVRTIALPAGNLERVLGRLADLKRELGRGPRIARDGDGSATLTVRTTHAGAVTTMDIELAHRVDAEIDEAGAGMATPSRRRRSGGTAAG